MNNGLCDQSIVDQRNPPQPKPLRLKSLDVYQKLCEVIPGGVNSPVRACKGVAEIPVIAAEASGDLLCDVDGRSYIDYCGSWGALIHGHAHPQIIQSAIKRMQKGSSFGLTTSIEEQLARKVTEIIPSIEKVRFVSSGTEATMSAVRLARGYTQKKYLVKFVGNYHGHADYFLVKAGSGVAELCPSSTSAGIPSELVQHTLCINYNDIEQLQEVFKNPLYQNDIAAVILEPVAGNMGVVAADKSFIQAIVDLCKAHDSLVIFDEVMTGFRVAYRGAQQLYQVTPDLTTLGKIVGGGFPAAAFGGRKEIMDYLAPLGPVYQAGTLSGNPVAMEGGLQSLAMLNDDGFYEELERKTCLIADPVRAFFRESQIPGCVQQVGSMFTVFFGVNEVKSYEDAKKCDFERFKEFFCYLLENGVYIPPLQMEAWFVSMAHTDEHLEKTRDLIIQFLKKLPVCNS